MNDPFYIPTVKIKEEPQPAPEPSPLLDKQYHCEQCRAEFSCFERLSRHVTMVHSSRTTETGLKFDTASLRNYSDRFPFNIEVLLLDRYENTSLSPGFNLLPMIGFSLRQRLRLNVYKQV